MIIHDKFIFLHMQKCAGTAMRHYLPLAFPGAAVSEHPLEYYVNIRDVAPKYMRIKFIFGNIRNPWDWYISLYFYWMGRANRKHYQVIVKNKPDFKTFMVDILIKRKGRVYNINFDKMHQQRVGIMTQWHDRVFRVKPNFVNKVEHLEEDFVRNFAKYGLPLNEAQIKRLHNMTRVNESVHGCYKNYYDNELKHLVADRERHIIKKYTYKFNGDLLCSDALKLTY